MTSHICHFLFCLDPPVLRAEKDLDIRSLLWRWLQEAGLTAGRVWSEKSKYRRQNIGVTGVGSRTANRRSVPTASPEKYQQYLPELSLWSLEGWKIHALTPIPHWLGVTRGVLASHHLHFKDGVVQRLQWALWLLRGYWGRKSVLEIDPISIRSAPEMANSRFGLSRCDVGHQRPLPQF